MTPRPPTTPAVPDPSGPAPLAEVLAGLRPHGDGLGLEVPTGWMQGRTLYGGLSAALCLRAGRSLAPPEAPLRSCQLVLAGPLNANGSGPVRFRADLLRRGRSVTVVGVDGGDGEGAPAVRALLVFGAARPSRVSQAPPAAPPAPPPLACPPLGWDARKPAFLQAFDLRRAGGSAPLSPGSPPELLAWARLREPAGADAESALLAVADALPPAAMVAFEAPAPISTISWTLQLAGPAPPPGWRLLRSAGMQAAEGYASQAMGCWTEDGVCVATGVQTVAVFA